MTFTLDRREQIAFGFFAVALVIGGGSRGLADSAIYALAGLLLPLTISQTDWRSVVRNHKFPLLLFAVLTALFVIQLTPVPASWLAAINSRAPVFTDLDAVNVRPERMALTLDSWGSVRGVLWALTAFQAWLLALMVRPQARIAIVQRLVVIAVLMALLGFAQAASGKVETLRFFSVHNDFGATGAFANRNHFGILMAMVSVVSIGLLSASVAARRGHSAAWGLAAVLTYLAATLSFSRTAFLLGSIAVLVCSLHAWWQYSSHGAKRWGLLSLIAGIGLAVLAVLNYAWTYVSARFDQDMMADLRFQYVEYGSKAAQHFWPWGSGVGSFRYVYAPFEPTSANVSAYALHAHNDFLEVLIEAGWLGVLAMVLLAVVVLMGIFTQRKVLASQPLLLAMAVASVLPMIHSAVDYPLRTLSVLTFTVLLLVHWTDRSAKSQPNSAQ